MAATSREIVSQEKSKYCREWWSSKAFDMLAASVMICKWKIYSLSGRYHLLELIMIKKNKQKKTCLLVNYPDPGRKKEKKKK